MNHRQTLLIAVLSACLLCPCLGFSSFLLNTNLNPCGRGVSPSQCTCPNGGTYSPGSVGSRLVTCGLFSGPPSCSCPNGANFTAGLSSIFRGILG